mgnify:CR=1 FL=1
MAALGVGKYKSHLLTFSNQISGMLTIALFLLARETWLLVALNYYPEATYANFVISFVFMSCKYLYENVVITYFLWTSRHRYPQLFLFKMRQSDVSPINDLRKLGEPSNVNQVVLQPDSPYHRDAKIWDPLNRALSRTMRKLRIKKDKGKSIKGKDLAKNSFKRTHRIESVVLSYEDV